MTRGGIGHHSCRVSSRAKSQVGSRIRLWRVRGEVGGWCEVGHAGQRCLRLELRLAGGVGGLELVRQSVALLARRQVVQVKEQTEDNTNKNLVTNMNIFDYCSICRLWLHLWLLLVISRQTDKIRVLFSGLTLFMRFLPPSLCSTSALLNMHRYCQPYLQSRSFSAVTHL